MVSTTLIGIVSFGWVEAIVIRLSLYLGIVILSGGILFRLPVIRLGIGIFIRLVTLAFSLFVGILTLG